MANSSIDLLLWKFFCASFNVQARFWIVLLASVLQILIFLAADLCFHSENKYIFYNDNNATFKRL